MSLADYLAKNYLTPDSKPEKKAKKRKRKDGIDGLIIADDDALGWSTATAAKQDDDDGPLTVGTRSAEFRKAKSNNWKTLDGAPATLLSTDDAAADAIIASAAAESSARALADEDAPVVEDTTAAPDTGHGLQTAAQMSARLKRVQAAERHQLGADGDAAMGKGQETIYRDASGRIINIAMKRAELRKKADDDEAKRLAELQDRKGDVQRAQAAKRREELADARYLTVARYADDVELNDELREKARWNDPAAQFLASKKAGRSVTGRPLYAGAAPPNRYGIRPGHRWDGVDRGNGFEKEYFAARNRRTNLERLDYAWQMDE